MDKLIIPGITVVGLSMSPAWALKYPHHAHRGATHRVQPAAVAANTAAQTTWPFGGVSDADKAMYARTKRESGVK
jgi:hypothetical protein